MSNVSGGTCASLPPNLRAECEANSLKPKGVTCVDIACIAAPCMSICNDANGNPVNKDGSPIGRPMAPNAKPDQTTSLGDTGISLSGKILIAAAAIMLVFIVFKNN